MPDVNAIRLDTIRHVVFEVLGPNPIPVERRKIAEILNTLAKQQRYRAAAVERAKSEIPT